MKGKDVKQILVTAISLFLICAVSAGLVAVVNGVTDPTIKQMEADAEKEAKQALLPAAESFEELAPAERRWVGKDKDGSVVGYVFVTAANGYNGKVEVMTGFTPEGAVTGIEFLTLNETPGLGMKAPKVLPDQIKDQTGELNVVKHAPENEGDVQAITSATITSKAVVKAVNEARALFEAATGKEAAK